MPPEGRDQGMCFSPGSCIPCKAQPPKGVLVLLEEAQAVCCNVLRPRETHERSLWSFHPGLEEIVSEALVKSSPDAHRLLLTPCGPISGHVGVASHQINLVVELLRWNIQTLILSEPALVRSVVRLAFGKSSRLPWRPTLRVLP